MVERSIIQWSCYYCYLWMSIVHHSKRNPHVNSSKICWSLVAWVTFSSLEIFIALNVTLDDNSTYSFHLDLQKGRQARRHKRNMHGFHNMQEVFMHEWTLSHTYLFCKTPLKENRFLWNRHVLWDQEGSSFYKGRSLYWVVCKKSTETDKEKERKECYSY